MKIYMGNEICLCILCVSLSINNLELGYFCSLNCLLHCQQYVTMATWKLYDLYRNGVLIMFFDNVFKHFDLVSISSTLLSKNLCLFQQHVWCFSCVQIEWTLALHCILTKHLSNNKICMKSSICLSTECNWCLSSYCNCCVATHVVDWVDSNHTCFDFWGILYDN